MNSLTFTIEGDVNVQVTITDNGDGTLRFDIEVLDTTGSIGDLNAIFFDIANDSIADGLIATGDDVSGVNMDQDSVTKVDNYTNMNGEVIKETGKFDAGVQFGSQGIGEDDIRSTSFTLSHETESLSLDDLSLQDFGIRLTSVGEEDGSRDGSLKLGGTSPEVEEPPVDPVHIANDDVLTVSETEAFNEPDADGFIFTDVLDSGDASLLANDTTDGGAYTGNVTAVNGNADISEIVEGSNGGFLLVYADGTVDFSAYGVDGTNTFESLDDGMSEQTTFEYTIEGGDTATLTVIVQGESGDIDGPPPPDDGGGVIIDG